MKEDITIRKLPPVWFIDVISAFRSLLLRIHRKTFPASVVLYERFSSFWFLPALRVAAELDIAGILRQGARPVEDLAVQTGTDPEALSRLMRALASEGVFRKRKDGRFVNTSQSLVLADGRGSLRHMMMQHLGTVNWNVLNELSYSIKTGKPAFSKVHGKSVYEFLSENPDNSALFDRSMTNLSEISVEPLLSAVNFSKYKIIADIGGGEGLMLSAILHENQNASGILFDLPEGMKASGEIFERFGVTARVKIIPGNFFETAPAGADAYLLKNVLHNWNTEPCVTLLRNIVKAMPANGRILILEMIVDEGNTPFLGKLIDLQMMVFMEEGKERTLKEYREMLAMAGLKIDRVVRTIAPISVIEAVKA